MLPNKNSSGHDNISNILLPELKLELETSLTEIFNLSISTGVFPEDMKLADILPLFKSGSRTALTNYRPILLLPTISKLLEKLVYSRVYTFLNKNDSIFKSQYGFRQKHSCKHAVTKLIGKICKGLGNNKNTIALYIDLSKAFDTISHDILYSKLEHYGICGTALNWFKSYLSNRKLCAKCHVSTSSDVVYSKEYAVNIGTP